MLRILLIALALVGTVLQTCNAAPASADLDRPERPDISTYIALHIETKSMTKIHTAQAKIQPSGRIGSK